MTHLSDYTVVALLLAPYGFWLVLIAWVAVLSARIHRLERKNDLESVDWRTH
jgi:hypothetical protein